MNGAEYIVEFFKERGVNNFFLLTGGACAFIIDAIGRNPGAKYTCFQHEQAAAMAADALYRIDKKPGVTLVTSGPGATNLLTGIASSYFDSIPTIHITGQVNKLENADMLNSKARQIGFQETNIVDMVEPITKYAVQVNNGEELKEELEKAYNIAISGRMGPVLIDVPMNVQKEEVGDLLASAPPMEDKIETSLSQKLAHKINQFFESSERPLVLFGAGIGLSGSEKKVEAFLTKNAIPFVSSWNGMTYFDHDNNNYYGAIGVYGNRGGNFAIQNCDRLLVLGSRLDNRQRGGNVQNFAMSAKVMVVDVDEGELGKYSDYETISLDLKHIMDVLSLVNSPVSSADWKMFLDGLKEKYFGRDLSKFHIKENSLSPYQVVQKINKTIKDDAIVIGDTGATLCWMYQIFHRKKHLLFTSGGNSPMGYSFPAAIGAALHAPERQVISFNGDGGFQLNLQELQTVKFYNLNVKIIILNNDGYGMIKQFQDSYCEHRYEATGKGYSCPDFEQIAKAYGIRYQLVKSLDDINEDILNDNEAVLINVVLHKNTLIEPKLEMGRPIHDQFPYLENSELIDNSKYCNYRRSDSK